MNQEKETVGQRLGYNAESAGEFSVFLARQLT
jgi:hypothetical protein